MQYVHCQQHASCAVRTLLTAWFECSMNTANSTLHVQYVHCQLQHASHAECTLLTARFMCSMHTANSTLYVRYVHY